MDFSSPESSPASAMGSRPPAASKFLKNGLDKAGSVMKYSTKSPMTSENKIIQDENYNSENFIGTSVTNFYGTTTKNTEYRIRGPLRSYGRNGGIKKTTFVGGDKKRKSTSPIKLDFDIDDSAPKSLAGTFQKIFDHSPSKSTSSFSPIFASNNKRTPLLFDWATSKVPASKAGLDFDIDDSPPKSLAGTHQNVFEFSPPKTTSSYRISPNFSTTQPRPPSRPPFVIRMSHVESKFPTSVDPCRIGFPNIGE
jgi:hypothetical protein